ncbi:MAG: helix-turn-helix transcriptional regulator [Bacteroidia bacterium]|nr:helix-turn-helix transcriptional regulator [Bacteroidia bacterium]
MRHLKSGQHFGINKRTVRLDGTILTEAGYTPDINVPWHYHENAYFFYHLRGRLDEVNKKKTITCTTGTLLFHHWQDPHCDKNFSKDAGFFHIEIENAWFQRQQLKPSILEGSMQLKNPVLKPIFQKVYKEMKLNDGATQISVDGLLLQSLAEITRIGGTERSPLPGWVKKVREIVNDTIQDGITLQTLSEETGIHPVHLCREFPKYFHAGFGQYIRGRRVEKAVALLTENKLSLSEIAFACGFSDQSHFIRCFKEAMGTTPSRFRRSVSAG